MDRSQRGLALFLPRLDDGGAERVMMQLGASFAVRGHEVDLVVAVPGGPLESRVSASLRLVDLGARRSIASLPALVRYLRRARPRALLSTLEHANVLAAWAASLARTGVRIVLREANVLMPRDQMHGLRPHVERALMRRSYRRATAIVCVSKAVERDLVDRLGIPPARVRTIYNPIVRPELAPLASATLHDDWLSGHGAPVVLGVGRLAPQKDFATLIQAFAVLRARRAARLVILGEGRERGKLEALASALGVREDVRLPGYDDNPFRWMSRSHVFVLSSLYEGLPGALVQAMACGCRVIATDAPGGSCEIIQRPEAGVRALVPPRDAPALARAIDEMLAAADNGTARVVHDVHRFEERAAVDAYLDVLGAGAA